MTVALQKNGQEPCGNKLGRIGMGEVNNDWSNFILTAIQHYWNELALSVWPLAEQFFTKPRNLSDSLGTAQAQTHVAPREFSPHTSCCSYLCCTFLAEICSFQPSELLAGNIIYLSYLYISLFRNLVLNWM